MVARTRAQMSIRQIAQAFSLQAAITAGQFQILANLANVADDAGGNIYAGIDRIAQWTGLSPTYVQLTIKRLVAAKWMQRERMADGRKGYRLTLPVKAEKGSLDPKAAGIAGSQKRGSLDPDKRDRSIPKKSLSVPVSGPTAECYGWTAEPDPSCTRPDPCTYARSPEVLPTEGVRARSDEEPRARVPLPAKAGSPKGIFFPGTCGVPLQRFLVEREFVPALVNELRVPPAQAEMLLLSWCADVDARSRGTSVGGTDPLTWWRQAFAAWRGRPVGLVKQTVGARNRELLERRLTTGRWS